MSARRRDHRPARALTRVLVAALVTLAAPRLVAGDQARELVAAQALPLTWTGSGPAGPGWDWLVREARAARFVALGEQHGMAQVPALAGALLEAASLPEAPLRLALENGALGTALAVQALRDGGRAALDQALRRHPMTLAFCSVEDLGLLERAVAAGPALAEPVWGLDQECGAAALLATLPPSEGLTGLAPVLGEVSQLEARRLQAPADPGRASWLVQPQAARTLDGWLRGELAPGTRRVLEHLRASCEVYGLMLAGQPASSNAAREEWLKARLDEALERSVGDSTGPTRVLVRAGAGHLSRLGNQAHQPSLGNHLGHLARAADATSLHVAVFGIDADGGPLSILGQQPGAALWTSAWSPGRWLVIPTAALRDPALRGQLGVLDPWQQQLVAAYDAVVLVDAPRPVRLLSADDQRGS